MEFRWTDASGNGGAHFLFSVSTSLRDLSGLADRIGKRHVRCVDRRQNTDHRVGRFRISLAYGGDDFYRWYPAAFDRLGW